MLCNLPSAVQPLACNRHRRSVALPALKPRVAAATVVPPAQNDPASPAPSSSEHRKYVIEESKSFIAADLQKLFKTGVSCAFKCLTERNFVGLLLTWPCAWLVAQNGSNINNRNSTAPVASAGEQQHARPYYGPFITALCVAAVPIRLPACLWLTLGLLLWNPTGFASATACFLLIVCMIGRGLPRGQEAEAIRA